MRCWGGSWIRSSLSVIPTSVTSCGEALAVDTEHYLGMQLHNRFRKLKKVM